MEDKCFESVLEQVKLKVQIIPENFQKTLNFHMKDENKKKTMAEIEPKAKKHYESHRARIVMKNSNICKMSRREALAIQK